MDWSKHQVLEKSSILLLLGILVVVAIGGLFEIAPLFFRPAVFQEKSKQSLKNLPTSSRR